MFFIKEDKFVHQNWHCGESNVRAETLIRTHSKVSNQHDQANSSEFQNQIY